MNRRSFLRSLLGAPVAVAARPLAALLPRQGIPSIIPVLGRPGVYYIPKLGMAFKLTLADGTPIGS